MEIRELKKEEFPKSLFEIPEPPKKLFIIGEPPKEDLVFLAIVGSRRHTSYGKDVCEKLIDGLKGYPICIISGLALGIDSIAHKRALENKIKTIAFPGSGLSKKALYPKSNLHLAEEILYSGGCLLSEFEPDFNATPWSFPMRNRLMAGISKAVLIIEAEEKSGTLITARLALDYNKDVFAVPGSIFSRSSKGTNRLIRGGATPITDSLDLLDALGFKIEEKDKEIKQKNLFNDLGEEEKLIWNIIEKEPTEKEELMLKLKMPAHKINAILSLMEIKGIIKEEMGEIRLI